LASARKWRWSRLFNDQGQVAMQLKDEGSRKIFSDLNKKGHPIGWPSSFDVCVR
jgi:hypothetical protein